MNARTKEAPPQTHSAQALADMPLTAGRDALKKQECAYMQEKFGKAVLAAINAHEEETAEMMAVSFGTVTCCGLTGRIFEWEATEHCPTCDDHGELYSAAGVVRECPDHENLVVEIFHTDYDGQLLIGEAAA